MKNKINLNDTKQTVQTECNLISHLISEKDVSLNTYLLLNPRPVFTPLDSNPELKFLTIHLIRSLMPLLYLDSETYAPYLIHISKLAWQSDFPFECPPFEAVNWRKFWT